MALTKDASAKPGLFMEVQTIPSIDGMQTFSVQQPSTWMDPIISYIKDDQLPSDLFEAKKVRVRATRFTVLNDELSKRGFSLPYLKCLNPEEAMHVM